MILNILAIGRAKQGAINSLFNEYQSRMKWQVNLYEIDVKKPLKGRELTSREAAMLLSHVHQNTLVVVLDGSGKELSSIKFAKYIKNWRDTGTGKFTFIIGGANGLDKRVLSRADLVISFGSMTWPHMLIRAMLIEQLYRCQCILSGHPYHRT